MTIKTGNIMPALQYKDAHKAIEWFCRVLGFEKKLVVPVGERGVAHAQLTLGSGMIMVSSFTDSEYSKHMTTPEAVGGKNTHYNSAKAAGAEFLVELRSEEYGGRYYSLKDTEGHLWSIGSYDPYAEIHNNSQT